MRVTPSPPTRTHTRTLPAHQFPRHPLKHPPQMGPASCFEVLQHQRSRWSLALPGSGEGRFTLFTLICRFCRTEAGEGRDRFTARGIPPVCEEPQSRYINRTRALGLHLTSPRPFNKIDSLIFSNTLKGHYYKRLLKECLQVMARKHTHTHSLSLSSPFLIHYTRLSERNNKKERSNGRLFSMILNAFNFSL